MSIPLFQSSSLRLGIVDLLDVLSNSFFFLLTISLVWLLGRRGGKIGPTWWASPARLELGLGWAIKLLA